MSVSYPDLNLTNFPESVDTFVQMLNIVASDYATLSEYQSAMEEGNVVKANTALSNMVDGVKKILTADKINKIFDSIEALQRFLSTDIVPYIAQLQSNWQSEVDKFAYRGVYSSSTTYYKNNIVSYTIEAHTYLYINISSQSKSVPPTDSTVWQQFTVVGAQGLTGDAMSFLYEWNNATQYTPQDCVSYNGKLWGCVSANQNSAPSSSNNKWKVVMEISPTRYPIQSNTPSDQENGDIWFQVV
ncbi:MAG: hypothetical protein J6T10_14625 [Methanobrevibacter sp.]|nr:hypothetical protein [Methanobrevibacter sp.]